MLAKFVTAQKEVRYNSTTDGEIHTRQHNKISETIVKQTCFEVRILGIIATPKMTYIVTSREVLRRVSGRSGQTANVKTYLDATSLTLKR